MSADNLSLIFSALSDPTRRAILAKLSEGDVHVSVLAEPFAMSLPAITKHLKVLENAGLISRGRDAQRRPCHLEANKLQEAALWVEQYRALWNTQLDQLDSYLQTLQQTTALPSNP